MRRTKRFWHAGLLFLVYSCLYVYSDKVQTSNEGTAADTPEGVAKILVDQIEKSQGPIPTTSPFQKDMVELQPATNATLSTTEPTTSHTQKTLHAHPTWRPKRTNCSPPAIEQFPKPIMGPGVRKHGGLYLCSYKREDANRLKLNFLLHFIFPRTRHPRPRGHLHLPRPGHRL